MISLLIYGNYLLISKLTLYWLWSSVATMVVILIVKQKESTLLIYKVTIVYDVQRGPDLCNLKCALE